MRKELAAALAFAAFAALAPALAEVGTALHSRRTVGEGVRSGAVGVGPIALCHLAIACKMHATGGDTFRLLTGEAARAGAGGDGMSNGGDRDGGIDLRRQTQKETTEERGDAGGVGVA